MPTPPKRLGVVRMAVTALLLHIHHVGCLYIATNLPTNLILRQTLTTMPPSLPRSRYVLFLYLAFFERLGRQVCALVQLALWPSWKLQRSLQLTGDRGGANGAACLVTWVILFSRRGVICLGCQMEPRDGQWRLNHRWTSYSREGRTPHPPPP